MWGEVHPGYNDISGSFSCVFSDSLLFSPIPWFVSVDSPISCCTDRTEQMSPHRQRKEFVLLNDVSVWRKWVCWWWGVRWAGWRERETCGLGGGGESPTEKLNSITDWKRGRRTLYKDEEKRSTFNLCNLKITSPLCLLPTGASLLKSLSPKRDSQSAAQDQTKSRRTGDKKRGSG